MRKICLFFFLFGFLFIIPDWATKVQKVEVTVHVANLRDAASINGKIIGKAQIGDVFKVIEKVGSWYKIKIFPKGDKGEDVGYISETIVKVLKSPSSVSGKKELEKEKKKEKKKKERKERKAAKKAEREKKKAEKRAERARKKAERARKKAEQKGTKVKVITTEREGADFLFKGFFLKAGYMTDPKVDSLGDKWVVDFGFDSPIGKYATWGLEFQPYFRSDSVDLIDLTSYNLTSNFFLNVKGGINLGKLWEKLKFMTVFIGAGPGVSLSYLYVDYQGNTGTDFNVYFNWHLVYGVGLKLGKMDIIVEFQNSNIINTDIDPSTQKYKYFLVGLRF